MICISKEKTAMSDNKFIICSRESCTGCGLCLFVCKHNAISLRIDKYGFYYPVVEKEKCVNCGLCKKKCPSTNQVVKLEGKLPLEAYACYNLNNEERKRSSSGGLGYLMAQSIIKRGGVVYGCAFTVPNQIQHIRCTNEKDIQRLRGSKYVQSNTANVYPDVEKDLIAGTKVLFIGTPCQVAGIRIAFAKYENLYTVDLICHGVPSMQFLLDTLPNTCIQVYDMKFRNGNKFHFSLHAQNNGVIFERNLSDDIFMKGFFNGTTYRINCYTCLYAQHKRISDITIGDFWGCKSTEMNNVNHGISLALINTEKGNSLFEECQAKMKAEQRPIEEAFAGNEQLNHPFKKNFRGRVFKFLYPVLGYNKALWCALPDKVLAMKLKNALQKRCYL